MTTPNPPPAVKAINARRRLQRISIVQAATRAGMSEAHWRQFSAGYRRTRGQVRAIAPDPVMLARMAMAIDYPADELERFDPAAARALRTLRAVDAAPEGIRSYSDTNLVTELSRRLKARSGEHHGSSAPTTTEPLSEEDATLLRLAKQLDDRATIRELRDAAAGTIQPLSTRRAARTTKRQPPPDQPVD